MKIQKSGVGEGHIGALCCSPNQAICPLVLSLMMLVTGPAVRDRGTQGCVHGSQRQRPEAAQQSALQGRRRHAAAPPGRDEPEMAPPQSQEHGHKVSN